MLLPLGVRDRSLGVEVAQAGVDIVEGVGGGVSFKEQEDSEDDEEEEEDISECDVFTIEG